MCHLSYPAAAVAAANPADSNLPGSGAGAGRGVGAVEKCTEHSCCRVTHELIFECVAVKEGGCCVGSGGGGGGGGGGGEGNGEYEEVVYVPFARGEVVDWERCEGDVGVGVGVGVGSDGEDGVGKENEVEGEEGEDEKWEVIWDGVAEEDCSFHDAVHIGVRGGGGSDWDGDNSDEGDSPCMEFWSFDSPSSSSSSSSSSPVPSIYYSAADDDSLSGNSSEDDGTAATVSRPCGKSIVYFEDPGADGDGDGDSDDDANSDGSSVDADFIGGVDLVEDEVGAEVEGECKGKGRDKGAGKWFGKLGLWRTRGVKGEDAESTQS